MLGPAGVGKTTILKSICVKDRQIKAGVHVNKIIFVLFLVVNTPFLIITYLFEFKRDRWFSWREIRAIVYLKAWYFILTSRFSGKNNVVILDHGPIFRLAFLDEFGPDFYRNSYYKKWWNRVLETWYTTLDAVIWLDAPNEMLLKRIQLRDRWHEIKNESDNKANEYLDRYRSSCQKIITKLNTDLKVLEFDTKEKSPDQISHNILDIIDLIEKGEFHTKEILENNIANTRRK